MTRPRLFRNGPQAGAWHDLERSKDIPALLRVRASGGAYRRRNPPCKLRVPWTLYRPAKVAPDRASEHFRRGLLLDVIR
jgi:hypothetical protein